MLADVDVDEEHGVIALFDLVFTGFQGCRNNQDLLVISRDEFVEDDLLPLPDHDPLLGGIGGRVHCQQVTELDVPGNSV